MKINLKIKNNDFDFSRQYCRPLFNSTTSKLIFRNKISTCNWALWKLCDRRPLKLFDKSFWSSFKWQFLSALSTILSDNFLHIIVNSPQDAQNVNIPVSMRMLYKQKTQLLTSHRHEMRWEIEKEKTKMMKFSKLIINKFAFCVKKKSKKEKENEIPFHLGDGANGIFIGAHFWEYPLLGRLSRC